MALATAARLSPRRIPTVGWSAGRAAGGHTTAMPHAHAISTSAAGRQRSSVYRDAMVLTPLVLQNVQCWGQDQRCVGRLSRVSPVRFSGETPSAPLTLCKKSCVLYAPAKTVCYIACDFLRAPTSPTRDPLGNSRFRGVYGMCGAAGARGGLTLGGG